MSAFKIFNCWTFLLPNIYSSKFAQLDGHVESFCHPIVLWTKTYSLAISSESICRHTGRPHKPQFYVKPLLRGDSTWRQISAKGERYSQQQKSWAMKHFVGRKLVVCRPQLFYCYVELLPAVNSRATREKNGVFWFLTADK